MVPGSVPEAAALGEKPGFAFLGGGTYLNRKNGAQGLTLISLEKLGLSSIESGAQGVSLGAAASFQSVLDCPDAPPGVRRAVSLTASRTLRNMMTIGGEAALRSSSSALLAVLVCLGAQVRIFGRRKPVEMVEYIGQEVRGLILSILIPAEDAVRLSAVAVLRRTSHAPAGLVVAVSVAGREPVRGVRITAGDNAAGPVRLRKTEAALEGRPLPDKETIEQAVGAELSPQADIHASAAYKRYMAGVIAADLLHGLLSAGGKA